MGVFPREEDGKPRRIAFLHTNVCDHAKRKERFLILQNLSYVILPESISLGNHSGKLCTNLFVRILDTNYASGSTCNNVHFGFSVRKFVPVWVAWSKLVTTLATTGSKYLASTYGHGASEETMSSETLPFFQFTEHG